MTRPDAPLVRCSVDDKVAVVTLDDPDRRNVLSKPMVEQIVAAFDRCEADQDVHAVVLTGAGRAFCAGADLSDLLAVAAGDSAAIDGIYDGFLRVAACKLPTVAAVNGPAVGAGLNLALACDVRVAADRARFECRFGEIGLHPGGGHTWMLRQAVNAEVAAAMLLFGESFDGEGAVEVKLARRCVAAEDLLDEAIGLARRATRVPVEVLRITKQTLRDAAGTADHATLAALERERQLASMAGPEFSERVSRLRTGVSSKAPSPAPPGPH